MVLGSQPSRVAIYPVPPCPSLAASMAAYRLRSLSESESWNIRIECSISALYGMAGRPWRGLDCPGYGYTMRAADREVIESVILSRLATTHPTLVSLRTGVSREIRPAW